MKCRMTFSNRILNLIKMFRYFKRKSTYSTLKICKMQMITYSIRPFSYKTLIILIIKSFQTKKCQVKTAKFPEAAKCCRKPKCVLFNNRFQNNYNYKTKPFKVAIKTHKLVKVQIKIRVTILLNSMSKQITSLKNNKYRKYLRQRNCRMRRCRINSYFKPRNKQI